MTLRTYADFKQLPLGRISVTVRHGKIAAEHCADCGAAAEGRAGKIDRFERIIAIEGPIDPALRDKLAEIVDNARFTGPWRRSPPVVTSMRPLSEAEDIKVSSNGHRYGRRAASPIRSGTRMSAARPRSRRTYRHFGACWSMLLRLPSVSAEPPDRIPLTSG